MKCRILLILILCLAALIPSGCDDEEPNADTLHANFLVATDGAVRLKREGWNDYSPVAFGTVVRSTDLLEVDGSATVLCADLSLKTATGQGRQPCSVERGWLEYEGMRFGGGQRPVVTPGTPYILHPRNTLVLDPRPHLRWHGTGASSYAVSIVSTGKDVWSQSGVTGNTLRYPDDAPVLQPGTDYLLLVRDDTTGRVSTEDPAKGLGFRRLNEAQRKDVEDGRGKIMALGSLDDAARDLALAVYYAGLDFEGRGLWGEAWLLLELVAQAQDTPAVHLMIGDMSATVKLPDEAEAGYRAALRSAEALGDLESQAAAYAGLWRVKGEKDDLQEALALYEALGDVGAAEALRSTAQP